MKKVLKDYQQYFFLAGVILLHVADGRWVKRGDYDADQRARNSEVRELSEKLTAGLNDVKQLVASMDQLKDHETRLRQIEKLKL